MSEIKQYLKTTSEWIEQYNRWGSLPGFVLRHGRLWKPITLPRKYRNHKGAMKECYCNAANAAVSDQSLTYVEGYAASIIPVMHAWCVTEKGEVIELTWDKPAAEYYGIPFKREFMVGQLLKRKYYGLIDDWNNNWPLLRGEFPKHEWFQPMKGYHEKKIQKRSTDHRRD